jgi:hypothetical protein
MLLSTITAARLSFIASLISFKQFECHPERLTVAARALNLVVFAEKVRIGLTLFFDLTEFLRRYQAIVLDLTVELFASIPNCFEVRSEASKPLALAALGSDGLDLAVWIHIGPDGRLHHPVLGEPDFLVVELRRLSARSPGSRLCSCNTIYCRVRMMVGVETRKSPSPRLLYPLPTGA